MNLLKTFIACIALSICSVSAQEKCINEGHLKKLDASWEKAQLELDFDFIKSLLADDFIWVHNHANTIDDKTAVLERIGRYTRQNKKDTKSRKSKAVKVIISGTTGIVSGYTIIDRGPTPTTYHFMRTYVEKKGKCYLIANHTMAVPEKE
ncbi:nuclear transport factor 2 family protein [Psychroserpens sp. SPM9]|uniref:nuclear transport factor 2 family protein n=1 Tax=Psychroserpens sp. SPM9 TaxID=2975598 RepID=UPI0021A3357C|nr:nuclear transport factor 2 family protein [Psychroserpens sp. SPM9]MDG5491991.1 nuclear transport factor 2 family protein [Psychroserpens sp. SPM9]